MEITKKKKRKRARTKIPEADLASIIILSSKRSHKSSFRIIYLLSKDGEEGCRVILTYPRKNSTQKQSPFQIRISHLAIVSKINKTFQPT